jgi:hypothetical protein
MAMSILELCQWVEQSRLAENMRESWFPYVESAHVLGLSLSIGTVMWFDLRLLGVSMRSRSVSEVFTNIKPWMLTGFAIMFATGALLFASHATQCYESPYFRAKIALLTLAGVNTGIYHLTVDRTRSDWGKAPIPPLQARASGLISLILWFAVILAGRVFAYSL